MVSINRFTLIDKGLEDMNTLRKQELVIEWGFHKVDGGSHLYERNIYADQGYREFWEAHNPDTIQFYKGAEHTEDYKIDWSLFN